MCFDNVKKLHYNLSCCFSLFLAFFNNRSILQYPFIIPKVPWRALVVLHHPSMFLVILHHLSSSFVIPHHHLVVAQDLSTSPHYAMSSPNQNKMSSNQNFATQVRNYHGCPFWDLGMSQENPPPLQNKIKLGTCILHLYSLRCKPIWCFYIDNSTWWHEQSLSFIKKYLRKCLLPKVIHNWLWHFDALVDFMGTWVRT